MDNEFTIVTSVRVGIQAIKASRSKTIMNERSFAVQVKFYKSAYKHEKNDDGFSEIKFIPLGIIKPKDLFFFTLHLANEGITLADLQKEIDWSA